MVKVIGDFVEVQGKHEEKKVGPQAEVTTTYLKFISECRFVFSARGMVLALQRGSLTAATASQKECTPWLWSLPCLQTASLSYLLRCCIQRTPES